MTGLRTVQRYEVFLGFPVHRVAARARTSVLAFSDEIDTWKSKPKSPAGSYPALRTNSGQAMIERRRAFLAVAAEAKRCREAAESAFGRSIKQCETARKMMECMKAMQRRAALHDADPLQLHWIDR